MGKKNESNPKFFLMLVSMYFYSVKFIYVSLNENVFKPGWKKLSKSIFNYFIETQKKSQSM